LESFEVIDTAPSDMLKKLTNNELEGVVVWDPFAFKIENALKDEVNHESVQTGQDLYFLLLSTEETITRKEEEIERFLKALIKAQQHKEKNQDDYSGFLKERFQMSEEERESTNENVYFSVSLSQALLHAMEAEARWCIMCGNFKDSSLPNYLDYLEPKYLLKIDRDKVFLYK